MREGWEIKKLGEVCEKISRGISPKYIEKKGVIVLNQKCIRGHKINFELSRKHDVISKNISADKYLRTGDVLVNSTGEGTLGRVAQVLGLPNEKVTVDSHISIVRPLKDKFFLDFFGWAMVFIENEIANSGAGASGQTELARTVLENNFTLVYPKSLPEQQRIVAILDKAFAAIEKAKANAQQNHKNAKELFESYLQSVFEKKWEGWEEKKLGEICELINRGVSPKYLEKDGVIVLNQKCIRDHKISFELSRFHDGVSKKVSPEKMVKLGDVLINSTGTGTLGRVAQVRVELKNVTVDSHVTIVRPIPDLFFIDFFGWALIFIEEEIAKRGEGCGGQTELARNTLKNDFIICFPKSLKEQQTIVQKLDALSVETKKLEAIYQQKIDDLEELKKSVLQKAFSGELS